MNLSEEEKYRKSLETIECLIDNIEENSPEFEEFMKAFDFVKQYEEKHFPLPKANFVDKIRFWFQFHSHL